MKNATGKLSNVQTLIIIFIILIILMSFAYYYFFRQLEATGQKISTLSNEADSLIAEETNLNSLRAVFSATTNDRQKINSLFVQPDGTVDFLNDIENLATFSHLSNETQSVKVEEEDPGSTTREWLHITFKTKGTWQNTYYFISLLESLPFNIVVKSIDLHGTSERGATEISGPSLDLSGSSTPVTSIPNRSSIWEATYDFSIKKMK